MFQQLIKHFGSRKSFYTLLDVSKQAFSQHEKSGYLPPRLAILTEELTDGKFKAKNLIKGK